MTEEEKKIEAQAKLISSIAEKVTEGVNAEVKPQLEKMGEDLIKVQRQVDEFKSNKVTIEETKEETIDIKSIFKGASYTYKPGTGMGSLAKMFAIETDMNTDHMGVKKALYMPRATMDLSKRTYKRDHSYDNLEGLMELNDTAYFAALAISHKTKQSFYTVMKSLDTYRLLNAEIKAHKDLAKALDSSQN
ncbi:hypothetical protein JW979_06875, partial [bacterium]|nr:hypothetical protein [candidate division CSSED10-310 bacterium]